jgi:hypothetical protein
MVLQGDSLVVERVVEMARAYGVLARSRERAYESHIDKAQSPISIAKQSVRQYS